MTATLNPPPGIPDLLRKDPAVRLRDYETALTFYVSQLGKMLDRIIFVENSGACLHALKARAAGKEDRVEFVSIEGMNDPVAYGRGYAEFKMLDHVMQNSRSVAHASPEAKFWKVTGRYRVLNLSAFIRRAPTSFDAYVDLRRYPVPWLDTRIMAWTQPGYRKIFRGVYEQLREDLLHAPAEQHLFTILRAHVGTPGFIPRFTVQPRVDGIRGYDNRNYNAGTNLIKYYIRSAMRKVAPFVWV